MILRHFMIDQFCLIVVSLLGKIIVIGTVKRSINISVGAYLSKICSLCFFTIFLINFLQISPLFMCCEQFNQLNEWDLYKKNIMTTTEAFYDNCTRPNYLLLRFCYWLNFTDIVVHHVLLRLLQHLCNHCIHSNAFILAMIYCQSLRNFHYYTKFSFEYLIWRHI